MPSMKSAATVADYGRVFLTPGSTKALASLPNKGSLDLLQIFAFGGKCVLNVSSTGVVSLNPVTHTKGCLFNKFRTRLTGSPTIAQIFADVWSENKSQQDILQVIAQGGIGVLHIDYLGVSYAS